MPEFLAVLCGVPAKFSAPGLQLSRRGIAASAQPLRSPVAPLTDLQPLPALCAHGRFGPGDRLVAQREFRVALRAGKRMRGDHLQVIALPQRASPPSPHSGIQPSPERAGQPLQKRRDRLGLSVSRAVGNSPQRARLRRLLREAFRAVRWQLRTPCDVVIIAKTPWPDAGMAAVAAELLTLLTRLRLAATAVQL